jgi:replicative DNA helicase
MDGNGHKPDAEDVRAAFDGIDIPAARPLADNVLIDAWAVLGSAIQTPAAAAEALAVLVPQDFPRNVHQVVFEAVERLADAGEPVGPVSVMSELARTGWLAKLHEEGLGHSGAYLHSLIQRAGPVGYHAPKVLAYARRTGLQGVLRSCQALAESDGWDIDAHPDQIRKMVEDATSFAGTAALRPNSDAVTEVLGSLDRDEDPGLPTGFPDLDDAIGGLRPGEVIIIAGRPGSGKTLTGLCIADHVGTHLKLPVLFESLEMPEAQLTLRRIAAEARVPLVNLIRHQVTDDDWRRIGRVTNHLLDTELRIDAPSRVPVSHMRRNLRAMERAGAPARLLVIDYLGYIREPKAESRQQAVAENVRQVHDLAGEFGIPVILLAQLNRGPELRAEKRPVVADLRETGEAEQTADIAILIHREDAYEPESPRAGEVDLLIGKNRQGPLCTVTLAFQGHYGRMVSLGREWSPSSAIGENQ